MKKKSPPSDNSLPLAMDKKSPPSGNSFPLAMDKKSPPPGNSLPLAMDKKSPPSGNSFPLAMEKKPPPPLAMEKKSPPSGNKLHLYAYRSVTKTKESMVLWATTQSLSKRRKALSHRLGTAVQNVVDKAVADAWRQLCKVLEAAANLWEGALFGVREGRLWCVNADESPHPLTGGLVTYTTASGQHHFCLSPAPHPTPALVAFLAPTSQGRPFAVQPLPLKGAVMGSTILMGQHVMSTMALPIALYTVEAWLAPQVHVLYVGHGDPRLRLGSHTPPSTAWQRLDMAHGDMMRTVCNRVAFGPKDYMAWSSNGMVKMYFEKSKKEATVHPVRYAWWLYNSYYLAWGFAPKHPTHAHGTTALHRPDMEPQTLLLDSHRVPMIHEDEEEEDSDDESKGTPDALSIVALLELCPGMETLTQHVVHRMLVSVLPPDMPHKESIAGVVGEYLYRKALCVFPPTTLPKVVVESGSLQRALEVLDMPVHSSSPPTRDPSPPSPRPSPRAGSLSPLPPTHLYARPLGYHVRPRETTSYLH
jgi:hypothetical protein